MDLSNRVPSKYYKDSSIFNSVIITIGIVLVIIVLVLWGFSRGTDAIGRAVDKDVHTEKLVYAFNVKNISYTKIDYKGMINKDENNYVNTYEFFVAGYKDTSMASPQDVCVKARYQEDICDRPKYLLSWSK
jgi:hypothetical protein